MNYKIRIALLKQSAELDIAHCYLMLDKPNIKEAIAVIDRVRPKLVEIDKALEDKP